MYNLTQSLKVILLAIVLSFGISYVFAWTAPTVTPTGGNSAAPLNTSSNAQTKNGNLFLNALGITNTAPNALNVAGGGIFGGSVGIGTASPLGKLSVVNTDNPNTKPDLSVGNTSYDSSSIAFTNSYGTTQAIIKTDGEANGSTSFRIRTMGQDSWGVLKTRFGIDWSGDVYISSNAGIGITAPTEKLDVLGNIKASGTICGSGGCIGGGNIVYQCPTYGVWGVCGVPCIGQLQFSPTCSRNTTGQTFCAATVEENCTQVGRLSSL